MSRYWSYVRPCRLLRQGVLGLAVRRRGERLRARAPTSSKPNAARVAPKARAAAGRRAAGAVGGARVSSVPVREGAPVYGVRRSGAARAGRARGERTASFARLRAARARARTVNDRPSRAGLVQGSARTTPCGARGRCGAVAGRCRCKPARTDGVRCRCGAPPWCPQPPAQKTPPIVGAGSVIAVVRARSKARNRARSTAPGRRSTATA